jgi:hypothetical protein
MFSSGQESTAQHRAQLARREVLLELLKHGLPLHQSVLRITAARALF